MGLSCTYSGVCGGCDWLDKSADEQRQLKFEHLRATWSAAGIASSIPEIAFVSIADGGLRDRVDLTIENRDGSSRLGLFSRIDPSIVDLEACPQMSPALEAWFKDFRRYPIPVRRGSVRLRVSPSGQRGVWLDLANVDVKTLLDERALLDQLRSMAIVEIGQRRKRLIEVEGRLKLGDPVLEPWFETYSEAAIPLYCTVGSFTQPGFAANRALVGEVRRHLPADSRVVAEFGSGIGNFTLPLAADGRQVRAYEMDELALQGLRLTLERHAPEAQVEIHGGNFQVQRKIGVDFSGVDLMFFDPPRSGLMKFLDPLVEMSKNARPRHFVYVSCFAESFAADIARLAQLGYRVRALSIVDQFPQSRHYEIVAHATLD